MSFSRAPRPASGGSTRAASTPSSFSSQRVSSSSSSSTTGCGRRALGSSSAPAPSRSPAQGGKPRRISEARFDRAKPVDVFGSPSAGTATPFQKSYSQRDLPCVLSHGSVSHKLEWRTAPESVPDFDRVLCLFASGLTETQHPYHFVAQRGFKDMCESPGAGPKAAPLARTVTESIRRCLTSGNTEIYNAGLAALEQFARAVRGDLTQHLKLVIGQISRKMTQGKMRDRLTEVLNTLEESCGAECYKLIKSKIPVYHSVNFGSSAAGGLCL